MADPQLYAISTNLGGFSTLEKISLNGNVQPLFGVGNGFQGGLTYHPLNKVFYALSRDSSGFSTLETISLSGEVRSRFGVGFGFRGGLAYRYSDMNFYAIASDATGFSTIFRISLSGAVTPLFGIGMGFTGGLAYDPTRDLFYAISQDQSGFSFLNSISLSGATAQLFGIGFAFRGGLTFHPGKRLLYAISSDASRWSTLTKILLNGAIRPQFGIGIGFQGAALSNAPEVPESRIWINVPLPDERFVQGETVFLEASVTQTSAVAGFEFPDGNQLSWTSDVDGSLGTGRFVPTSALSADKHMIEVSGYGMTATRKIRVFADLGALYKEPMAPGEMARIHDDFDIRWVDGATTAEQWQTYDADPFDITSLRPAKMAALAKLDVLRHQRFSEPLPIAGGGTIYDHVRRFTRRVDMRLDQRGNAAGGGTQTLNANFSRWSQIVGTPAFIPDPYVYSLQLFVHENRHNEPGEPTHTSCPRWTGEPGTPGGMDQAFEGGSGYAAAAMYMMWVYKYGIYDPASIRARAKDEATSFLRLRFCTRPTHSNAKVRAIIDELIP